MIPHPQSTSFDLANALACARASAAAYAGGDLADHYSALTNTRFISKAATGTQLFITADDTAVVVAFAGTQPGDFKDWLTDLKFRRARSVHRGFHAAWKSVEQRVVRAVVAMRRAECQPIFITGHSLGGALAVLCARSLWGLIAPVTCYTFGQPRVGNARFAADYPWLLRERTFRVVHEEDIVPRMPCWLLGYRHAGREVFLPSTRHLRPATCLFNPPLWRKLGSDLVGLLDGWRNGEEQLIADHAIGRYVARLEAIHSTNP